MSEEQGQAQEQPTTEQTAQLLAGQMLGEPEKKKPVEAPASEAPAPEAEQAAEQEAEVEEQTIELDLEAKMFEVEETREGGVKEKVKYSAKELMSGRMMQADYQRKTAELAREKEGNKEFIRQQTEPVIKQFQDKLAIFEQATWQAAAPELQGVDMDRLASENPAEWARKSQIAARFQNTLLAIQEEKNKLAEAGRQQFAEQQQKMVLHAKETLHKEIPNWSDETYLNIRKAGVENYGYSMEEVNQVVDARAIKVLHDAMKYRELQKAKPSVEKKVVNVPKVVKPGSPDRNDPNRESLNKAKAQLRKSGRTEDAIAVARHFFNDA